MGVQEFKGDATELKMRACADPLLDLTNSALDEFYENGFDAAPFLLMLYDEKRMPFSNRIPRAAFVGFIREALRLFPVIGIFESYLFVLRAIFGSDTEIFFDVPDPGKLSIDVGALSSSEFDFVAREFIDGEYVFYDMIDYDYSILTFRGLPGIDNEYDLNLLFAEIMPCGISPDITLQLITRSFWIAEEPGDMFFDMIDDSTNNIIFYEVGG
jgi:hypothetical protein